MRLTILLSLLLALAGCSVRDPAAADKDGKVTLESPAELSKAADVPLYPDAHVPSGRSRAPYKDPQGAMHYEIIMLTSDTSEKVLAFYRTKMKDMGGGGPMIVGKTPNGNDVIITAVREGKETTIKANVIVYSKE